MRWTMLLLLLLAGCSGQPVSHVTVYNNSGYPVIDVTVTAQNFTRVAGQIRNKDSATFKVKPKSVMSFSMSCTHPHGDISVSNVGYVEPSRASSVWMTINPNMTVSTDQKQF